MSAHDVYIDMLSVQICPSCPFDECYPTRCDCPLRMAREAQKKQVVTLPGPRPDGVMRTWKVEVEA